MGKYYQGNFGYNFTYIPSCWPSGNRKISDIFAGNFSKKPIRTSAKSGNTSFPACAG
jgi:hypothetical protein